VIAQIASALERAHTLGIVHRDLKPANVFLARHASGVVAKVLDFGVAKLCDDDTLAPELTASGALLGTPYYMSPEQIEGARYVDHTTDLWSLGVIAFECMTGRRPFPTVGLRGLFAAICVQPLPVPSALDAVPAGFDAWFARAAERDPRRRFRSAGELARALCAVCDAELAWQETLDETGERPRAAVRALAAERSKPRSPAWGWSALALLAVAVVWLSLRWLAPSAGKTEAAVMTLEPGAPASSVPAAERGPQPVNGARPLGVVPALSPPAARVKTGAAPRVLLDERAPTGKRRSWDVEALLRDRK
jgi:hypothetical protein